jgi:hypothetical protein
LCQLRGNGQGAAQLHQAMVWEPAIGQSPKRIGQIGANAAEGLGELIGHGRNGEVLPG